MIQQRRLPTRLLSLITSATLGPTVSLAAALPAAALEWENVPNASNSIPAELPPRPAGAPQFIRVAPESSASRAASRPLWTIDTSTDLSTATQLAWEAVPAGEEIVADAPAQPNAASTAAQPLIPPSGPTYANFRALWRDGDWLPQISNTVPTGFGPKGVMATFEYRGIDCITGAGLCTIPNNWQDYQQQISNQGDAFFDWSLGFGDSSKYLGVVLAVTIEGTETPFGNRQANSNGFLADKNLGIHITRNLSPDTSIRLGINNLFREVCDNGNCGLPQSAFGVISQRLRLNPDQNAWFANAYLTAGAGNGSFRSLGDQIQASYLAQREAGCSTYGYQPKKDCSAETRRRAVFSAYDYGKLFPIASLGVEVVKGFNLISEWSGRNLNAGLSFRPFPELGLVITPMFENLLPNCDYGCKVWVPDYPGGAPLPSNVLTERPRFSIQASIEVKF